MPVVYAVESYTPETNTYSRHEVGSKDDMVNVLNQLVSDSLESRKYDSYYRVNEVSEKDKENWDLQVKHLPSVKNTDKLFGEWVQIGTASKYLGVTFGRVFNLITSGDITASTVGRNKLVSVRDVVERKITKPKSGRPSRSSSAGKED